MQNGKLVGAVTHVLVNDLTRGRDLTAGTDKMYSVIEAVALTILCAWVLTVTLYIWENNKCSICKTDTIR